MTAQHGGKRPGAGRKPGARNRATVKAKRTFAELAKDLSEEALNTAAEIMRDVEATPSARMAAVNTILDRAFGKPRQEVDHQSSDGSMAPITGFDIRVAHAPASDTDEAAS